MSRSFQVVEDKAYEVEFFLKKLEGTNPHSFEGKCYFSAFVASARTLTFALQACLRGYADFDEWYKNRSELLKADKLSKFFKNTRDAMTHTGDNPLNLISMENLRAHLYNQLYHRQRNHVIEIPFEDCSSSPELINAIDACRKYFINLLEIVYECYDRYKHIVDSQWYYTKDNFLKKNKTIEDALSEMGYPPIWSDGIDEDLAWQTLARSQSSCFLNFLFETYLQKYIASPLS